MNVYIYMIQTEDGDTYIGQTANLERRIADHLSILYGGSLGRVSIRRGQRATWRVLSTAHPATAGWVELEYIRIARAGHLGARRVCNVNRDEVQTFYRAGDTYNAKTPHITKQKPTAKPKPPPIVRAAPKPKPPRVNTSKPVRAVEPFHSPRAWRNYPDGFDYLENI